MQLLSAISRFFTGQISEQEAYDRGKDCGSNGPNLYNCDSAIFSNERNKEQWEKGKREAEESKNIEANAQRSTRKHSWDYKKTG
jgi:hypothetical protein